MKGAHRIYFEKKQALKIVFSSLIFRVESINEKWGDLYDFAEHYDLSGTTNGKLFVLFEMFMPAFRLERFVAEKLHPLGFKHDVDYVFADEQLVIGCDSNYDNVTPYLNKQNPDCKNAKWLDSLVKREGNFVWFVDHKRDPGEPEDRYWKKFWITCLKQDEQFGNLRFKQLDIGYPSFEIDRQLIDKVDAETFNAIEKDRIPFFLGSQFGIHPKMDELPGFFNGDKVIAVLNKSMLSGAVAGLTLYQIGKDEREFTYNKITHFENN